MSLHGSAALTEKQREEIKILHQEHGWTYSALADRFNTTFRTAKKWANSTTSQDKKSGSKTPRSIITPEYEAAILKYRESNDHHGPVRIAEELREEFPIANRGTVLKVLQKANLTRSYGKKKHRNI
jgi:hypothetical protein